MSDFLERVVVTGLGIVAPPASIGVPAFTTTLRGEGAGAGAARTTAFTSLRVEGVRRELPAALLDGFAFAEALKAYSGSDPEKTELRARAERLGRRSARTVQVALLAALEAIIDADLLADAAAAIRERCGVVVAGQNLNQRTVFENAIRFKETPEHLSPPYAMHHLDTDHVGAISELLGSQSEGMTVGGASASGNVAIVQAMRMIRSGYLESCLVVGAMTDLSPMELAALESLGALAGEGRHSPEEACRPFDREREGFVYGQSCACILLESLTHATRRGAAAAGRISGEVLGGSIVLDGRRSTEPSAQGEARAMRKALADANVRPEMIDYVNAHGTASRIGDATELEAIADVFAAAEHPDHPDHPDHLARVWVNSTKGLVGHGLSSAGVVEAVATILQMRDGFVHPNRNLANPLRDGVRFAPSDKSAAPAADLSIAMSNSFGFGGFNSSIILGRFRAERRGEPL